MGLFRAGFNQRRLLWAFEQMPYTILCDHSSVAYKMMCL
jgi:hypothetical protein